MHDRRKFRIRLAKEEGVEVNNLRQIIYRIRKKLEAFMEEERNSISGAKSKY